MKKYLLDSGPLAAYLIGRPVALDLISPWISQHEAVTSMLVYGEVIEYFKSLPDFHRRQSDLQRLLNAVFPYVLSYPIMERYADIRRTLRPPHGPGIIGDVDTLIAATALEYDLTVVTTDSDFERVPELHVQIVQLRRRSE